MALPPAACVPLVLFVVALLQSSGTRFQINESLQTGIAPGAPDGEPVEGKPVSPAPDFDDFNFDDLNSSFLDEPMSNRPTQSSWGMAAAAKSPTFPTAFHELRRWSDEVERAHKQEVANLREACKLYGEQAREDERELIRLAEQVKELEQEIAVLKQEKEVTKLKAKLETHLQNVAEDSPESVGDKEEVIGDFVGVVKFFNAEKGFGFITCDALGQDIYIQRSQVGDFDIKSGVPVMFEAYWLKGRLQGRRLQAPPENDKDDEVVGTFAGVIKTTPEQKSFGFIHSDELQKDIFYHRKAVAGFECVVGAPVIFEAYWHKGRLQARNLHAPPDSGQADVNEETLGNDSGFLRSQGSIADKPSGESLGEHYGVIKAFYPEKDFGFIKCDALKDVPQHNGGKDVFFHRKHAGDCPLEVNLVVRFEAFMEQGKIAARSLVDMTNVEEVGSEGGTGDEKVVSLGAHSGVIKVFYGEKGWGFITCPELADYSDNGQGTVWVHKSAIGSLSTDDLEAGVHVFFTAMIKKGRLQARHLELVDDGPTKKKKQQ